MDRAKDAGLDGFYRIVLVMNGRSRTGKVIDPVHLQQDRLGYVVADKLEAVIVHEMDDVPLASGKKIIETDDIMPFPEQSFTQVRTDKTGASCNQYTHAQTSRSKIRVHSSRFRGYNLEP